MGIVDKKKQELTNKAKKQIIKIIKPYLIGAIIFMLIASVFFVAITSIADKMKNLLNVAATFVSNIWKWITDDYWIDLTKEIDIDYTDSSGNTVTESRTLIDHYMYQLDELGISLKDLKLLGDADYSDPNLLEDPENKAKVQKYLKSFVVADLITSQIHRRNSSELVYKPSNATTGLIGEQIEKHDDIISDKIDGGIYLYRTKDVTSVSDISNNNGEATETGDNLANCYRMEYLELEKFRERVDAFNEATTGTGRGNIENYFTIDEDGNLLIAQVDGYVETEKIKRGFFDESQYEKDSSYTATIKKIDYKKEVAQYTLPYEFLVDLCMVTQNPEFVYHVAEMSLNTNISLLIQNNETTVVDEEVQNGVWVKEKKSKGGNVSEEGRESYTRTKTKITTTTNPILKVKGVNTWSTYKKIEWRDRVLQNENENQLPGTYSDTPGEWNHVPAYIPNAIDDPTGTIQGHDEYWEREYFKDYKITTTHTTVTNNYYSIEGNVIRKSDNFLGLLRNKTGQYIEGTTPKFDVDGSKFDRNGINVSYKIPGRSIEEDPLSKLKSGEQMLYSTLKQNERTEPLVELIQYYLTYPEQEYYDLTEQEVEDILGGFNDANQKVEYDEIKDAAELEILYKICEAEAGGSSEEEIGHVASVILNRVKCSSWGNTIKEVVFQKSQFAPVSNGRYEKANPSQKTKNAVDKVLSNGDTTGGAVYFRTEESAKKAGMPTSSSESHATYIYLFTDPNTHVFLTNKRSLEELKGSATSTTKPATGKLKDIFPDGIPTTREGIQKYLTTISVPITTKNGDKKTKTITINKAIAQNVKEALKKAQDGGFKVYDVQCFNWRDVKGSNKLSQHAYGLAVDINVNENCQIIGGKVTVGSFWKPGENEYSIPKNGVLVKAFKEIGWGWGGDWKSSKDYMHFSYTGQ